MLLRNLIPGCAIALSLLAAPASATVTCTALTGSISVTELVQDPPTTGPWKVAFTHTGSSNAIVEVTGASTDVIQYIRATGNSSASYKVELDVSTVASVGETALVGGSGELWVRQFEPGAVGDIYANIINYVRATSGDIYGDITQFNDASPLASTQKGIDTLISVSGSITGDITAVRDIGTIDASAGSLGTNSSTRSTITASTKIGSILVGDLFADITISTSGSNGDLDFLETKPSTAGNGDFYGSLSCKRIVGPGVTYGLEVKRHLYADVTQSNAMATNFRVWGTLSGDISLPASGLTRQIIINANWPTSSTWSGDVIVGGSRLRA